MLGSADMKAGLDCMCVSGSHAEGIDPTKLAWKRSSTVQQDILNTEC